MSVKLLTEHDWEFLSLKGDCTASSVSTLVKMPHCWKSHVRESLEFIDFLFSSNKSMAISSLKEHYWAVAINDYGRHLADGETRSSSLGRIGHTSTCRQQIYEKLEMLTNALSNMVVLQEQRKLKSKIRLCCVKRAELFL